MEIKLEIKQKESQITLFDGIYFLLARPLVGDFLFDLKVGINKITLIQGDFLGTN
jgi:hypothetical protein